MIIPTSRFLLKQVTAAAAYDVNIYRYLKPYLSRPVDHSFCARKSIIHGRQGHSSCKIS